MGEPQPVSAARIDPLEDALADALSRAAAAGEWTVVAALARELEARRAAPSGPAKASN